MADQSRGVVLHYESAGRGPLQTLSGAEVVLNNPRGVGVDGQGIVYILDGQVLIAYHVTHCAAPGRALLKQE